MIIYHVRTSNESPTVNNLKRTDSKSTAESHLVSLGRAHTPQTLHTTLPSDAEVLATEIEIAARYLS